MDLVNIFYGEDCVSEMALAYHYVKCLPEDKITSEMNSLENQEAKYMTALNIEWYEEKLGPDECIEMCKELWRTRFKLQYVRERFYGIFGNNDDSDYVRVEESWGGEEDEKMDEEEANMEDITSMMKTLGT